MPKATGTRGQLVSGDGSGGYEIAPPEQDAPTLASMGVTKAHAGEDFVEQYTRAREERPVHRPHR